MFMQIADSDGNGLLSFEEVYYLASISMKKNFMYSKLDLDNCPFLDDLVDYLTKFIFKICEVDFKEEIPLTKILDIIMDSKTNYDDLLLFFCGADYN